MKIMAQWYPQLRPTGWLSCLKMGLPYQKSWAQNPDGPTLLQLNERVQ